MAGHKRTGEETANLILRMLDDFNMSIVRDYVNLPLLPTNVEMEIVTIGKLNFNPDKKTVGRILKYGMFTSAAPNLFPMATDMYDYHTDECVAPIVVKDNNEIRYRIDKIYWHTPIPKDVLPKKIFIDDKYIWINNLMN